MTFTYTLDKIETAIEPIENLLKEYRLFLLYGNLGTGKTTMVKTIAKKLGMEGVKSPTFSLIDKHNNGTTTLYHCDFYRLKNIEELWNIGFYDIINSADYLFIEWPEIAVDFIEEPSKKLFLKKIDDNSVSVNII